MSKPRRANSGNPPEVVKKIEALNVAASRNSSSLRELVQKSLADRNLLVRSRALGAALQNEVREFEPEARRLLADRAVLVRVAAVEYLGWFYAGTGISARWLYPMLEDCAELVRVEALDSLGAIGDRRAVARIACCLRDKKPLVRAYAASALGELKARKYLSQLQRQFQNEKNESARVGLAAARFEMGDAAGFDDLLSFLGSTQYVVRCAAANSLTYLKLNKGQKAKALAAITYASKNFIARADQPTMLEAIRDLQ